MVLFHIGIPVAEYVDLLGIYAIGLELGFNGFQVIKVVADVIVPIHDAPPDSRSILFAVS
ncbi:hypothetical protein D3C81_1995710 [compost metagenome]